MPLPGSDKYRKEPQKATQAQSWADRLIEKANTEVRVEDVLRRGFGIVVPYDARSWKTRCPLAAEHEDGGLDKQFRVYSETNTAYCFDSHGRFDPIRLWSLSENFYGSRKEVAERLLEDFGIEVYRKTYQERFEEIGQPNVVCDPDAVTQAFQVFLTSHPNYDASQYRQDVLHGVNLFLDQVREVCDQASTSKEVERWFHEQKRAMATLLDSLS